MAMLVEWGAMVEGCSGDDDSNVGRVLADDCSSDDSGGSDGGRVQWR